MSIAVTDWNGRVSPVFDVARHVIVEETGEDGLRRQSGLELPEGSGEGRIDFLLSLGVAELICGAISRPVRGYGLAQGLVIHPFVSGPVDPVLDARHEDRLGEPPYLMPGCGRRGHGRCRRGRSFRNNM